MDLIMVVILGFLLFVLPEMLRSKKKREYEYPEIPDIEAEERRPPLYYTQEGVSTQFALNDIAEGAQQTAGQTAVMPAVPPQMEEANPWTGRLSLPHVVNGVIFAEILQPPRAKRPIACWWRKQ